MKLELAVLGINHPVEQLLQQLGIAYYSLELPEQIDIDRCPILFCLGDQSNRKTEILDFIANKGAVLFDSIAYKSCYSTPLIHKKVKNLFPNSKQFTHVGICDLYTEITYPKLEKTSWLDEGLKITEHANSIILPFDLETIFSINKTIRKKFIADRDELPSERVSMTNKSAIRKIILCALELLYDKNKLPLIQKWYYPEKSKSHFIFRVDTDFCNQKQADDLYKLCKNYQISATWFVDTKDNERLRNFYSTMENQEVELHCWHHLVFTSYQHNIENINKGKSQLEINGITARGFAAPLGEWNHNLNQALIDTGFCYSSEFSYNYDDFPLFSDPENKILQIPIHPISSGRLRRSHFSIDEMKKYFLTRIDEKIANSELIVFYHHPSHPHLELFEYIFKEIRKREIPTSTLGEFYDWWILRNSVSFSAEYDNSQIKIDSSEDIYYRIFFQNEELIVDSKNEINIDNCDFSEINRSSLDEKRSRRRHWRDYLYNYETARGKRATRKSIKDIK